MSEQHLYLIALGGNVRHPRYGAPAQVLAAATDSIDDAVGKVVASSPVMRSAAVGPSARQYANAAIIVRSKLEPRDMLLALKDLEAEYGRRTGGQRWSARTLDCDIVLWSGGVWADDALTIPHPLFRERDFVLQPAAAIAPDWRDPLTNLSIRQLLFRNRHQGA
ncbi:2-amino-4-hydroxy-6-hydroxymethyldihydropteridine diphosphokinase [Croceicoccus gelatinilyticus]|uniref:2-amino-4-hydroxy-6- hydroxymethyldihydropteridine diphosphokinase n=1 Tax=Croceicoccus gelatinilyticus TaxID=2835536 RepID=UPI001BCB5E39|nr:2-amino-4-hydroxy-6-hydroxymethyldihydropteridine diphosphokinase [Croceicoccus gelatinilyticus]MBS7668248.1 2-amino-4-hydroxy-6-hydroxymethyldihydropteridine diphosphokinase [Croceicoccus gelatinilyticus]